MSAMSAIGAIQVPPHFIVALALPFEPEPDPVVHPAKPVAETAKHPARPSADEPDPQPVATTLYPK